MTRSSVAKKKPAAKKPAAKKPAAKKPAVRTSAKLSTAKEALAALEKGATRRDRENLARFGITAPKAFGVSVAHVHVVARQCGRSHALAEALWDTEWYEARLLAAFVDEPARVTPDQMDRWCDAFDNWAVCDTACFHLFDRTPHAWAKIEEWSDAPEEFVRRASFALLASLAGHDKKTGDAPFLESLALVEKASVDDRNFVKKAVSWALRRMGRRSPPLRKACLALATRLATSASPAARWTGRDTLRDLSKRA